MPMSLSKTNEFRTKLDLSSQLFEGLYPAVCSKKNKAVIYSGDFENTSSDIKLLNYNHLGEDILGNA